MRFARPAMLLLLASGLWACAHMTRSSPQQPQPPTVLSVENNSGLDMNMYVVAHDTQRERLGLAIAHRTSNFVIPARLLFGPTPLRFQADPVGGNRTPVTDQITVIPGDTVVLRIPVS